MMHSSRSVGVRKLLAAAFVLAVVALARVTDAAAESAPSCLQGPTAGGFSAVTLETCAYRSSVDALYAWTDNRYVSLITAAPEFVNRAFHHLYPDGVPAGTRLIAKRDSASPPDPDPPLTECSAPAATARVSGSVAAVRTADRVGTAFYAGNFRWLTAEHVVSGAPTVRLTNAAMDVTTVLGRVPMSISPC